MLCSPYATSGSAPWSRSKRTSLAEPFSIAYYELHYHYASTGESDILTSIIGHYVFLIVPKASIIQCKCNFFFWSHRPPEEMQPLLKSNGLTKHLEKLYVSFWQSMCIHTRGGVAGEDDQWDSNFIYICVVANFTTPYPSANASLTTPLQSLS